jgi:hypothetical protein
MPFLLAQIRRMACSHLCRGMWLASKMVPTLTVEGLPAGVALVNADPGALAVELADALGLLAAGAHRAVRPEDRLHEAIGGCFIVQMGLGKGRHQL